MLNCKIYQRFRMPWEKKQDAYFWINFDHFWSEIHSLRQLRLGQKLAWAQNQTTISKFSLSKTVKRSVDNKFIADPTTTECKLFPLIWSAQKCTSVTNSEQSQILSHRRLFKLVLTYMYYNYLPFIKVV